MGVPPPLPHTINIGRIAIEVRTLDMTDHLLIYTDDPGKGGVGIYNHTLLCGLARSGYRVTCVQSLFTSPMIDDQRELGIQHIWLDFDTLADPIWTVTRLSEPQKIFNNLQPDLIVFSDCHPGSNFAAKRAATQLGIPYIIVENCVISSHAEDFSALIGEIAFHFERSRAVIAVSHENLELLYEHFQLPADKGQVIYYGRPEQYFALPDLTVRQRLRQERGIPTDGIVCFTAARLDLVKGYQYQWEAIQKLQHTPVWHHLYFVWAGHGMLLPRLQDVIDETGIADHVKILGQCWNIPEWLDASDIFILTSLHEGMPLCIMEAMAKGLPVIATAVSGVPEELGDAGILLSDPKIDAQATVTEIVATIQDLVANQEKRRSLGQACQKRAKQLFREARMLQEMRTVIETALATAPRDYISPNLVTIHPDSCFPHMIVGDPQTCPWPYLRREIPHKWYVDNRLPSVGFLNRDEAHILYNTALQFKGRKALEIGCWLGWSACHLALAGVELDVIDPLLDRPEFYESVTTSLKAAGVLDAVNLVAGLSQNNVEALATAMNRNWSLIFIDGDHEAPAPFHDAVICSQFAEADAIILFHDLAAPAVSQGLEYLRQQGWYVMVYQTMQIMGVAWRGNVEPMQHQPDPQVDWLLPPHLSTYTVSGLETSPLVDIREFQEILETVRPYTLLSEERLLSLYSLAKQICLKDIPGNFAECGVCRGGSTALLAIVIKRYSLRLRRVYAFDTFEGMPDPIEIDKSNGIPANQTGFGSGTLKAPIAENLDIICQSLNVRELVVPVLGLFSQTLPEYKSQVGELAFLHADGDWYESTLDIFTNLYDNVVPGGIIQVDDYGHWEGCKKAIHEFENLRGEVFHLKPIDYTGAWFQKNTSSIDLSFFQSQAIIKIEDDLNLRRVNLIIFPDWEQPRDQIYMNLVPIIRSVLIHPDRGQMTLLVDTSNWSNYSEEDFRELFWEIATHIFMTEELEVDPDITPEVSPVRQLTSEQWLSLISRLQGRLALEHENLEAIIQTGVDSLECLDLTQWSAA